MFKKYNQKDPQLVLIHGGPGAIGSLHQLFLALSNRIGVIEHIQTQYTIQDLLNELYADIIAISHPVTLLGHSWGALLAGIFAATYPHLVSSVILVGCPPLDEAYTSLVDKRRQERFSKTEAMRFEQLLQHLEDPLYLDKDNAIKELGDLVEKADNYCIDKKLICEIKSDGVMYDKIWQEASRMRHSGQLLEYFKKIKCPLYLLQGTYDPHPIIGVVKPLLDLYIKIEVHEFKQSGHSPFLEKNDAEKFNELVIQLSEPLHYNDQ